MLQAHTPRVWTYISSGSRLQMSDVYSKQLHAEASVLVGCGVIWRALARCAPFDACVSADASLPPRRGRRLRVKPVHLYIKPHSWKMITHANFCSQASGTDSLSCHAVPQSSRGEPHSRNTAANSLTLQQNFNQLNNKLLQKSTCTSKEPEENRIIQVATSTVKPPTVLQKPEFYFSVPGQDGKVKYVFFFFF